MGRNDAASDPSRIVRIRCMHGKLDVYQADRKQSIHSYSGNIILVHCSLDTVQGGNQRAKFAAFTRAGMY